MYASVEEQTHQATNYIQSFFQLSVNVITRMMLDFNSETPYKDKVIDHNIFVCVSCTKENHVNSCCNFMSTDGIESLS